MAIPSYITIPNGWIVLQKTPMPDSVTQTRSIIVGQLIGAGSDSAYQRSAESNVLLVAKKDAAQSFTIENQTYYFVRDLPENIFLIIQQSEA